MRLFFNPFFNDFHSRTLNTVYTQPDGTLFFLIFTYFRGRSQWNSRDYGSNVALCHFLKPETNKGDFKLYFVLVEKSCRGATTQKY